VEQLEISLQESQESAAEWQGRVEGLRAENNRIRVDNLATDMTYNSRIEQITEDLTVYHAAEKQVLMCTALTCRLF
jgi:hypothetical protein